LCVGQCALVILVSACASRRVSLPSDPGRPLPDYSAIHAQVSSACAGVRTFTAALGLAGQAGEQSLRGRVIAGFERPSSMRLEGVAPFGAPAFVLTTRADSALLVLPRQSRVVRDASPSDLLGALTGVTLAPGDLQAVLTGCVESAPRATAGRLHGNGWASLDLAGGATIYLQRNGPRWRVRAARRQNWQIEYPLWPGAFPQSVRLHADMPVEVDLTATISEVEANVDLRDDTFTVDVPRDAQPLTLEELREAGPLRGQ
jgi:outer membrane biogenesis lipoprotein LolB